MKNNITRFSDFIQINQIRAFVLNHFNGSLRYSFISLCQGSFIFQYATNLIVFQINLMSHHTENIYTEDNIVRRFRPQIQNTLMKSVIRYCICLLKYD